jgi:hypothetical protein
MFLINILFIFSLCINTKVLSLRFVNINKLKKNNTEMKNDRHFFINYDRNTFVKDGQPFRYVSGAIHPYRCPHELWQDRLDKMWTAGLNTIEVYKNFQLLNILLHTF